MTITHVTAPTQFVEIDGVKFAYRSWGNKQSSNPPLLLLQHFRGGMDHWDPLMTDGLAANQEVILFNNRGVASSTGTPCTRIEDMADDAAAFIRALSLDKVDVLGFSLGGFQAQDLTLRHPDMVRKLMLLGTGPRGGKPGHENKDIPALVYKHATQAIPAKDDYLFLFFGRSQSAIEAGNDFWERRHQRVEQDTPSSPAVMQAQIEANLHFLPKLDDTHPFAHLEKIKQPTFILNGQDDVMIPTINSYHMAQHIPNAQLFIYPDAGHGAHFQYPKRFLSHALAFLNE
ncbi:alpha/beta fold hydrolase [Psychrobacter sanguinis]|uniref:Alpha/beta fold hydrolase n=1 Tax=Psychrobacter sanguinis TaxID=861445 RepID=A0A844M178_9GAMM|nr:alpha/beta hydrolase [Psychrobacter sanguinis]MUG32430.1 alpha/beta fold hydrolase [Psychrobacter sanguinis]